MATFRERQEHPQGAARTAVIWGYLLNEGSQRKHNNRIGVQIFWHNWRHALEPSGGSARFQGETRAPGERRRLFIEYYYVHDDCQSVMKKLTEVGDIVIRHSYPSRRITGDLGRDFSRPLWRVYSARAPCKSARAPPEEPSRRAPYRPALGCIIVIGGCRSLAPYRMFVLHNSLRAVVSPTAGECLAKCVNLIPARSIASGQIEWIHYVAGARAERAATTMTMMM